MRPDIYIEAEYADGYVHREDEQDHSPFVSGRNIFNDILERRPEAGHGPMVRFSLVTPEHTYSVDWTQLPDNARPVRFKHMSRQLVGDEWMPAQIDAVDFGFQYTDADGQNVQHIERVA